MQCVQPSLESSGQMTSMEVPMGSKSSHTVSRRKILKTAAVALGGGATALIAGEGIAAQGGAPAILTGTQAGRRFRAFVKWNNDPT